MKVNKFLVAGLLLASMPATAVVPVSGKSLYTQHCSSCHQADGGGVPMMQPELIATDRANGPVGGVVEMILFGSEAIDPEESVSSNEMPAFGHLSDKEIALIATYVRTHFENEGGGVKPEQVGQVRKDGVKPSEE